MEARSEAGEMEPGKGAPEDDIGYPHAPKGPMRWANTNPRANNAFGI